MMVTLDWKEHFRPGERKYMSREWGCDPCTHCSESWKATRWDHNRDWICSECDERIDKTPPEDRRKPKP